MTIVLHALVPGDPERLRAAYDRTLVRVRPERLMHVMAPCDQGLRVTEIWTDEDELRGCMAEEIPGVLAAAIEGDPSKLGSNVPDGDIEFAMASIWDSRSLAHAAA